MDRRFRVGVWLIVASIVIGVAFKFYVLAKLVGTTKFDWFAVESYLADPVLAWATALYLLSWPMLFVGVVLCGPAGVKYAERFTKYLTHRYYVGQAKKHVPRLAKKGVERTRRIARRSARKTRRAVAKTKEFMDESGKRATRLVRRRRKAKKAAESGVQKSI